MTVRGGKGSKRREVREGEGGEVKMRGEKGRESWGRSGKLKEMKRGKGMRNEKKCEYE